MTILQTLVADLLTVAVIFLPLVLFHLPEFIRGIRREIKRRRKLYRY